MRDLQALFGDIDIYLFDQLLRGRLHPGMRVVDAGCGSGRNLVYFLQAGFDVWGIDADPSAIGAVQRLAGVLAPTLPPSNFRIEPIERTTLPESFADVVVSSAVLHFARDEDHFVSMLKGSWRLLKPGGLFFCRLASSIGIETLVEPIEAGRYRLPDGTIRYLVDEGMLLRLGGELGGEPMDPIKTTVVQHQRSMTTWVLRRRG